MNDLEKIKEYISSYDIEMCKLGVTMLSALDISNNDILDILRDNIKHPNYYKIDQADILVFNKISIKVYSVTSDTTDEAIIHLWSQTPKTDMPLLNLSNSVDSNIIYGSEDKFKFELPYGNGKNIPTIV